MAKQTSIDLRGKLMYSVFVRNHTKEGTFRALEADLDRLAALGMAALVMDNIGQGDRNPEPEKGNGPDHWFAVAPFQCGLTLQGMIVMETVAMIRHMQQDSRFDPARFGA